MESTAVTTPVNLTGRLTDLSVQMLRAAATVSMADGSRCRKEEHPASNNRMQPVPTALVARLVGDLDGAAATTLRGAAFRSFGRLRVGMLFSQQRKPADGGKNLIYKAELNV